MCFLFIVKKNKLMLEKQASIYSVKILLSMIGAKNPPGPNWGGPLGLPLWIDLLPRCVVGTDGFDGVLGVIGEAGATSKELSFSILSLLSLIHISEPTRPY